MNDPYQAPNSQTTVPPSDEIISTHSVEHTSQLAANYFSNNKYRLESGTPEHGIYGIGNDILRILFGAFVKRYKFQISISALGEGSQLFIEKAMSGAMGGVIGHSKMKKELVRVRDGLRSAIDA